MTLVTQTKTYDQMVTKGGLAHLIPPFELQLKCELTIGQEFPREGESKPLRVFISFTDQNNKVDMALFESPYDLYIDSRDIDVDDAIAAAICAGSDGVLTPEMILSDKYIGVLPSAAPELIMSTVMPILEKPKCSPVELISMVNLLAAMVRPSYDIMLMLEVDTTEEGMRLINETGQRRVFVRYLWSVMHRDDL
jgi:hypothetical protein